MKPPTPTAHPPELTGRTAIVTGASRGIGLAIARSLLDAGANVVLTSRSQASADAAAGSLGSRAAGFEAHAVDRRAAERCVAYAAERFGAVSILVNNAGTNPAFGPLIELDHARFVKTLEVNLWAPIMWAGLTYHAGMCEHGGAIVNVASVGGFAAGADTGIYRASKAALIHTTKQLALELAPSVRVNAVAPGLVRTRMAEALWKQEQAAARRTLLARIGEPEDIAGAVAFLVSDAARWMTGETIVVDGGQLVVPVGTRAASPDEA